MSSDTITALATPYGESAIAAIRISGAETKQVIVDIFHNDQLVTNVMYYGKYRSIDEIIFDEVMFVFFQSPHSYTGEDAAEIYTHGNMIIVENILHDLCARGCRLANRGEFTRLAFLNGKLDLCQAEAVADIIHASSEEALRISHAQLSGNLSKKVAAIDDDLLNILALLETHIDFIEDEIDNNTISDIFFERFATIFHAIEGLLSTSQYRSVLCGGLNVAIIGRPNAGKSSLLNLLLNTERALVSPEAGTTRDFISESIMLGGLRVNLLDTAGLREYTDSMIEKMGINKSIEKIKHADVYLFVVDTCDSLPTLPKEVISVLNTKNCCIIENKTDCPDSKNYSDFMPEYEHIRCSMLYNHDDIRQKIIKFLKNHHFFPSEVDVVVNARHVTVLENVKKRIASAIEALNGSRIECAAEDIRDALEILGEIVGQYTTDNMLDKLFNTFCIGK